MLTAAISHLTGEDTRYSNDSRVFSTYLKNGCLDFSTFRGQVEIPPGYLIDSGPIIIFLKAHPEITSVNITNHPEITNLLFSRFRKCLPNLTELVANDTELQYISGDQWLKYYANNIKVKITGVTVLKFRERLREYLNAYKSDLQNDELEIVFKCEDLLKNYINNYSSDVLDLLSKTSKKVIEINDAARQRQYKQRQNEYQTRINREEAIKNELVKSWESGKFSNTEAYKNGPKTFADWPQNHKLLSKELYILYLVVTELDMWDKMKLDPGDGGYMFSKFDYISRISGHPAVNACGHSGASLGCAMRNIQYIAKNGWAKFCEQ